MESRYLTWKLAGSALATVFVLAIVACASREDPPAKSGPAPSKTDATKSKTVTYKPLAEDVVKAWKEAGAEVGWLHEDPFHLHLNFVPEKDGKPGELPAFRFAKWQDGCIMKLPDPASPFGLSLGHLATDSGLKECAHLKSLQGLDLSAGQRVTAAGLKELAELQNLQMLNLEGAVLISEADLKGIAGLKNLQRLTLHQTQITDAGIKGLAVLMDLRSLHLGATQVTDAGLKELASLKNLQALSLSFKVMDAGLKELAGLEKLQALDARQTSLTDVGMKQLAEMKNLKALAVGANRGVTESGLNGLSALKGLRSLHLHSPVSDAVLKELIVLKDLHELQLYDGGITDAGLKDVAGFKDLRVLTLSNTRVTDAGLKELAKLQSLQTLNLWLAQSVTEAGVKDLRKALPDCKISR